KYFGFDRFQIDPYYSEYSGSTEARITVGKELRENLTATYSRGLSSLQEEQLNVEYRVDDNLSLMGSWSSEEEQVGQFGGDVILRYEFW
ncbi:MAG: translocation/assembly module TamB domain-containing protein, partial [Proteobacteria bacterium]|nr:translocation/assembly module TamB domain-containing protein [Pseudomonadota bacterium]